MNTQKISLKSQVVQNEGNIVSDMDGEKVMLNVQNGKYYNLGDIGGVIWTLIEQPIIISDLVIELRSEYEINQKVCEEHIVFFLELLLTENLIHIEEESNS